MWVEYIVYFFYFGIAFLIVSVTLISLVLSAIPINSVAKIKGGRWILVPIPFVSAPIAYFAISIFFHLSPPITNASIKLSQTNLEKQLVIIQIESDLIIEQLKNITMLNFYTEIGRLRDRIDSFREKNAVTVKKQQLIVEAWKQITDEAEKNAKKAQEKYSRLTALTDSVEQTVREIVTKDSKATFFLGLICSLPITIIGSLIVMWVTSLFKKRK